jgi:hypothetical protein
MHTNDTHLLGFPLRSSNYNALPAQQSSTRVSILFSQDKEVIGSISAHINADDKQPPLTHLTITYIRHLQTLSPKFPVQISSSCHISVVSPPCISATIRQKRFYPPIRTQSSHHNSYSLPQQVGGG